MDQLTPSQLKILERLNEAGAATISDLAARLRTLPEQIEPEFKSLWNSGLIETSPMASGLPVWYSKEIYRISDKGHQVLRFAHLV